MDYEIEITLKVADVIKVYCIGSGVGLSTGIIIPTLRHVLKINNGKFEGVNLKGLIILGLLSWISTVILIITLLEDVIDPVLRRKFKHKYWYCVFFNVMGRRKLSRKSIMEDYFHKRYIMKHKYVIEDNQYRRNHRHVYDYVYERFMRRYLK